MKFNSTANCESCLCCVPTLTANVWVSTNSTCNSNVLANELARSYRNRKLSNKILFFQERFTIVSTCTNNFFSKMYLFQHPRQTVAAYNLKPVGYTMTNKKVDSIHARYALESMHLKTQHEV